MPRRTPTIKDNNKNKPPVKLSYAEVELKVVKFLVDQKVVTIGTLSELLAVDKATAKNIALSLELHDTITKSEEGYTLSNSKKQELIEIAISTLEQTFYKSVQENQTTLIESQNESFDKPDPENEQGLIETSKSPPLGLNVYQGNKSNCKYFRYSYSINGKIKHCHIRGGNIFSQLAQNRANQIRGAIATGKSHQEIITIIKSW